MECERLDSRTLFAADLVPGLPLSVPDALPAAEQARHALIVQYNADATADGATPFAMDSSIQATGSRQLLPGMWRLDFPDAAAVDIALQELTADSRVDFVERDAKIGAAAWKPDDPLFSKQWAHQNTGAGAKVRDADIDSIAAWKVTKGTGRTVVAVVDTGIDWKHPDLKNNIWQNLDETPGNGLDDDGNGFIDDVRGWDFVNNDNNPMDDHGHGTHVAGIVGARGGNDRGVAGVSWKVDLMPLKFLDENGSGWTSDAVAALRYAVDQGATISNHSWGGGAYSPALNAAIAYAKENDHILVVAAGNDGESLDRGFLYPASFNRWHDNVVTVAATNSKDQLAGYSNYGSTTVDIAAPGSSILSTVPRDMGPKKHEGYDSYSGTSMATPFVAGAMSLVHDLHPDWSYRQIIDHVLSTADHPQSLQKVVEEGRRLNVGRAVTRAAKLAGMQGIESYELDAQDALPPTATLHSQSSRDAQSLNTSASRPQIAMVEDDTVAAVADECEEEASAAEFSSDVQSAIPENAKYKVTVQGKANGKSFSLTGYLEVKPTMNPITLNDLNPRDVFLKIGNPLGKPKTGAIWLATNNAFFGCFGFTKAPQKMDLANVDMNAGKRTLKTRVDGDLVNSGLNRFNASSGLLAPMYDIFRGGLDLTFSKSGASLKGSVQLQGAAHYLPGLDAPSIRYSATITGKRIK